ncbi:MAG: hypothetical protein MZV63_66535 [Marinilabiliales bacterium]|nr:hypothetical protein [Marinilabiliales bacterium]
MAGVPDYFFVNKIMASKHDKDTVYAADRQPQDGRLQAVPADERGPRPDLDEHRRGPAPADDRLVGRPGPRRKGPALRRDRVRDLRDARRRQERG